MSFGTYRQYDSRWGKKNYNGSSNYANAGCGPTSCANILYAINPSITPLTTGNWMKSKGYAIRNQGTAWNGIPACLKAFGASDVRQVDKMADVFSYCSKGYVGVFLFRKGTKGGVTWTTSGHYIAVTGYKHTNGKHYFKTFDSGGRKHDGWYCYETQMKGLIPRIWLCKVAQKVPKPSGKYSGTIPSPTLKNGSEGDGVGQLQAFLNWYHPAWDLKVDKAFGGLTESALRSFQYTEDITSDGIYGKISQGKALTYKASAPTTPTKTTPTTPVKTTPKTTNAQKLVAQMDKLAWKYGTAKSKYSYDKGAPTSACKSAMSKHGYKTKYKWSDCGNFVNTVVRESGIDKDFVVQRSVKSAFPSCGSHFTIVHKGKSIPSGLLKPGDIIRYKKTSGQHAMFYYGNGKVCDAGLKNRFANIRADEKRYAGSKVKKSTIQVLRVKE